MLKREVEERIVEKMDRENYGRMGVIEGWRKKEKIEFDVKKKDLNKKKKVM